jgi:hypothetical protein
MRVFVAGASGAIGTRLVPQLIDRGHEVIGTSRSPGNTERVRALGAEPIALDLLDPRAARKAVLETEPDAIVHQATALADVRVSKHLDRSFAETNRLRGEGTDALLAAARERACPASSPRASPTSATHARAGRSRPKTIRSTPPRCRRWARPPRRCATSSRQSQTPAESRFATAASTALPTTGCSSPCASGSSRSSAQAARRAAAAASSASGIATATAPAAAPTSS